MSVVSRSRVSQLFSGPMSHGPDPWARYQLQVLLNPLLQVHPKGLQEEGVGICLLLNTLTRGWSAAVSGRELRPEQDRRRPTLGRLKCSGKLE